MFAILESKIPAAKPLPAPADRCHLVVERLNISADGKRFKAFFATPGIVNYEDVPDGGQELIRKATIDDALQTFIGCPLTIGHVSTKTTNLVDVANGVVDSVGFDVDSGWYFAEGSCDTEQAREKIREGWGVSSGTRVLEFGGPGHWLNNPYDREVTKFRFHHLALVDPRLKPRYEEAAIRLNSTHHPPMFKWIRKIVGAAGEQPREESSDVSPDTQLDLGNGQKATLAELAAAAPARDNHCHSVGVDDHIEVEGVRHNVGQLVEHFRRTHAAHVAERPNTEAGARAEVEDAEIALHLAEREVGEAKKLADGEGSTAEHKRHHAAAVERHAAAVNRHNAALQHHQTFMSRPNAQAEARTLVDQLTSAAATDQTAAAAARVEADRPNATAELKANAEKLEVRSAVSARLAVAAKAHLDGIVARDNAAAAETPEQKTAREAQEAKDRETAAAAETARLAEVERLHAAELETERANARARGAASFQILGTARERQVEAKPQPMTHTLEAGLARGQELFGSQKPGNN